MEKEKSEVSEDTNTEESQSSDDSKESNDSKVDETESMEEPSQKGDNTSEELPFHKHPRFKEIIEARKEAERKVEKAESEKSALIERLDKIEKNLPGSQQIPEWFVEGFGESPELWNKFNAYNEQTRGQLKEEILNEINSKEQGKVQREEESRGFVRNEIQRLKDEGNAFDENKLKKIMLEYQVLDFDKGLELYKKLDTDNTSAKKTIASNTRSSGKSEGDAKVKTLDDMFNKSW